MEKGSIFAGVPQITEEKIKRFDFLDIRLSSKDDIRDTALFEFSDKDKVKDYGFEQSLFMTEGEIDKLEIGEEIYFSGYPLANEFIGMGMGITLATCSSIISSIKYSNRDKKVDFILIDKLVNPGNSGSPVFVGNKILGLASGTLNQTHRIGETLINVPVNLGMVRTANYTLDLLEKISK